MTIISSAPRKPLRYEKRFEVFYNSGLVLVRLTSLLKPGMNPVVRGALRQWLFENGYSGNVTSHWIIIKLTELRHSSPSSIMEFAEEIIQVASKAERAEGRIRDYRQNSQPVYRAINLRNVEAGTTWFGMWATADQFSVSAMTTLTKRFTNRAKKPQFTLLGELYVEYDPRSRWSLWSDTVMMMLAHLAHFADAEDPYGPINAFWLEWNLDDLEEKRP